MPGYIGEYDPMTGETVYILHENTSENAFGGYVCAGDLRFGDLFLGANGELSTLSNILRVEQSGGINVFNFEVAGNHNYFILAKEYDYGQTCVLVHNVLCNISPRKLQHEYKHAADFGITGPWNKKNGEAFAQAIQNHLNKPNIQIINGTYRENIPVRHYYEPATNLNVMVDMNNNLVGAWKLAPKQIKCLVSICTFSTYASSFSSLSRTCVIFFGMSDKFKAALNSFAKMP